MTDDGSSKEKYPDDSHSGYNDAELTPEQPDPNSGQTRDDEPARNSRRIAKLRSDSRRILTVTTISSIRSKAIIRTPSTHKTGISTPRAAMLGEARVLPPDGASQQASIPSKAGTDKTPSRVGPHPVSTTRVANRSEPARMG